MVFISRLKLRNFKSFKAADIQLPKTFICFAGPNGSGKSNLCDSIRFAMGETSLRSLRAKKVKDLIHAESKSAEVTITFEGDGNGGGYELKRAIREDGKILYRLDGKKVTRTAILEAIKKYNLDSSGRNTIAQGEVQRIISMNGKERRVIIDSVAGITDFEDKKKEAMGELDTVETRIKDANLVLGERRAFLNELKNEKETALKYLESKKTLTNAKATLLRNELARLEKELAGVAELEGKINFNKTAKEQDIAELDARVKAVDALRGEASREIQAKQKTNALIRRVEELRANCATKAQLIEDREAQAKKGKGEHETLSKELEGEHQNVESLRTELDALRAELKTAETKLAAQGGPAEDEAIARARTAVEKQEAELAGARERLIALASETVSKKELIEAKGAEEKSINVPGVEEGAAGDETKKLRAEAAKLAAEIDGSFAKTKEVNAAIAEIDRQMLELREKTVIFKVRSSPQLANPALSFIADLKQKDKGIHGTVADLISFEAKYASAVEAAAGSRLLYIVVDGVDTATSVIDKLKKAKAGRATFIPLDTVRTPAGARGPGQKAKSIIDFIDFPEPIRRAAEYVFAETLLVDDVAEAKKLGVGSARMVTLEGEIFERSGVVSGGRSESGILSGNQLRKLEKELADAKSRKDSLFQELYSIRERESSVRAEKSQMELRIKTIEMEARMVEDRRKETAHLLKRKEQLNDELTTLDEALRAAGAEKERLGGAVAQMEKAAVSLREQLRAAEENAKKHMEESGRKRTDLASSVSSLRATIEGKMKELELRRKDCTAREERARQLDKDGKALVHLISETKRQLNTSQEELTKLETEISSASKDIEKLFERMKGYEDEYKALGQKLGEKRGEIEKLNKDLNQLTMRKATATTHFDDIRAESANYQDAQLLDLKKDELNRMVGESERTLAELGNVNMAAIEMYDKRKQEIEEAEERIAKLDTERGAIMSMMAEIEEHKKEAFFETFQAVSDNFSGMFKHINIGEGHLYLDKPATPFESGLFIKIRRNNREYSLDALSGGEKTLVALMFIFALQFFKPAPFYILDEVDAALDKPNSRNLADLISRMTGDSQFIVVSHNDTVMSSADSVIGVAKVGVASKLVGVKLKQVAA